LGSQGRDDATGRGVSLITQAACQTLGLELKGARIVIQGFGNVGGHAARCLHEMGATIIGVGDATGAIRDENGLDIPALSAHHAQTRSISGFSPNSQIDAKNLLLTPCDILIPAALGGVIDAKTAEVLQTQLVIEAANAPVTAGGDKVLGERKIPLVPDILANAGGVIVSYFEWTQNLTEFRWKLAKIHEELEATLLTAYAEMRQTAQTHSCDWRIASYVRAIDRVAIATRARWMN